MVIIIDGRVVSTTIVKGGVKVGYGRGNPREGEDQKDGFAGPHLEGL